MDVWNVLEDAPSDAPWHEWMLMNHEEMYVMHTASEHNNQTCRFSLMDQMIHPHKPTQHTHKEQSHFIYDSASLFEKPLVQTKLPQLRFHPAFQIGCLSDGQWSRWEKQNIQLSHPLGCIIGLKSLILQSYQKRHQYRLLWLLWNIFTKQFMIMSYNEHYEQYNLVPLRLVPRAFHCSKPCSSHQSKVVLHDLENRIPWPHLHSNFASLFPTRKKQSIGLWVTRFWHKWPPWLQDTAGFCQYLWPLLCHFAKWVWHLEGIIQHIIISSSNHIDVNLRRHLWHLRKGTSAPPCRQPSRWWDAGNKNAATKLSSMEQSHKHTHTNRTNTNLQYWSIINLIPFSVFFNHTLWCHDMLWGEPVPVQMNQLESWQRQNCVKFTFGNSWCHACVLQILNAYQCISQLYRSCCLPESGKAISHV